MTPETRETVIARDEQICQHCGRPLPYDMIEIAHRIANTKTALKYIQRYAIMNHGLDLSKAQAGAILNHPINLRSVCRGKNCNDAMNCFNNPVETDKIIRAIILEMIRGGGIK